MNAGARDLPRADARRTGRRQLYLPDFCRARAVLAIVIICELTALVLALARNEVALGFWSDLARTSMFLLWIGLFGAGMLCVLRGYLNRQSLRKGSAIVLLLTAIAGHDHLIAGVLDRQPRRPGWTSRHASRRRITGPSCCETWSSRWW